MLDLGRADTLDDRARDGDGGPLVEPRQQQRELVATEPEALPALAQA